MIKRIRWDDDDFDASLRAIADQLAPSGDVVSDAGRQRTIEVFGEPLSPTQVVERICGDVRQQGLDAALEYGRKLDGAELTAQQLRVPQHELQQAHQAASTEFLTTIRRIRTNVEAFQSQILHRDARLDLPEGGYLAQRYVPLRRIGICVPGGAAAYPSTLLMTAVPAQVAGVKEIAVVAPPTPYGAYNQHVLATCFELGITEVYRLGGAQGVAALAYGLGDSPSCPAPVDKIVGPGNLFVALAKKHVFGDVDIDSIAGPSEVIVIADDTMNPAWTAADLIAQAEHAPGSSILISWSDEFVDQVESALQDQLESLSRGELARQSLEEFGAMVVVSDRDQAAAIADQFATEHLHIACEDPEEMLAPIRSAGAIFLGPMSPVAVGDYIAGPSHVLPTGATARFASGLSANSFLRSGSVIHYTQFHIDEVAEDVQRIATQEDLPGHAASVLIRQKSWQAE